MKETGGVQVRERKESIAQFVATAICTRCGGKIDDAKNRSKKRCRKCKPRGLKRQPSGINERIWKFGSAHETVHLHIVFRNGGNKCAWCGETENLHGDHILPLSKGGAHSYKNMQPLCRKCNFKKSNRLPDPLLLGNTDIYKTAFWPSKAASQNMDGIAGESSRLHWQQLEVSAGLRAIRRSARHGLASAKKPRYGGEFGK